MTQFANNLLVKFGVTLILGISGRGVPSSVPPIIYTQPCVGTHATNGESSTQLSNNSGLEQEPTRDIISSTVIQTETRAETRGLLFDLNQIYNEEEIEILESFQETKKYLERVNFQNFMKVLNFERVKYGESLKPRDFFLENVKCEYFTESVLVSLITKFKLGTIFDNGEHKASLKQIKTLNQKILDTVIKAVEYSDSIEKRRERRNQKEMMKLVKTVESGKELVEFGNASLRRMGKKPRPPLKLSVSRERGSR